MTRGGGAQSCEARWQNRRVVSHLHIADVAFLLMFTSTRIAAARKAFRPYLPCPALPLFASREGGGVRTLIAAPRCATFVRLALLPV